MTSSGLTVTGMRVLLVDDHAIVRQAVRAVLSMEPDVEIVGEAATGRAAIEETRKLRPEIVLMDLNMPVMNGIQATRAIHAEFPQVCIIGLSMHEDMRAEMRAAGAMDYVSKTSVTDQLISTIRACYERNRRQMPPAAAA